MPGFILHMTAAKMLFDKIHSDKVRSDKTCSDIDVNAFQVGNLIPDSVSDKTFSHFRHPRRQDKLIVYPDLDLFLAKYNSLLADSSCLGYYFHLFVDRVYARDYLPRIVSFHDESGLEVSERKDITHAFIKHTGELVPIKTFFSDEYYYGDFTKLNTYLLNRFQLSTKLNCDVTNPGIAEVHYEDIRAIQKQLEGYLDVSEDAVNELRFFETEGLLDFLENSVNEFRKLL